MIFPDDFIEKCKDNANEAQFVPLEVKNKIKWMVMEQGLYEQVVKILLNDLKFIAENKNKNEATDHSISLILTLIGLK